MVASSGGEVPLVAGIDFGTTQSLIATKTKEGIELISDPMHGSKALPSVVWIGAEKTYVGDRALLQSIREPSKAFSSIKRLLGRTTEELQMLFRDLPYEAQESEEGTPEIQSDQGGIHPVELAEEILRSLKMRAEVRMGQPLVGAVLTVPAYFDEVQRKCIKDAAHLAEIKVLRLLNEPTAAALAYLDKVPEKNREKPMRIAVYDLGGGTFDISILQIHGSFVEVLATGGDTLLGGDDLDAALAKCLQLQWSETFPSVLLGASESKRQRQQFLKLASKLKIGLSSAEQVEAHYGRWHVAIQRSTLDELAEPIIEKSLEIVSETLARAQLPIDALDEILLIGGPTRLPIVRQMVGDFFGKKPNTELDPEGAVAMGAAIHAANLALQGASASAQTEKQNKTTTLSAHRQTTLLDVTPLSFGLETLNGQVEVILPQNTPIPASCTHRFTNASSRQTQIPFHIVQGEAREAAACRSLAKFVLTDLPPKLAGEMEISVRFSVDSSGMLTVSVQECGSGRSHTLVTQPTYRIPADLMEELEEAEEELGEAPVSKRSDESSKLFEEIDQFLVYLEERNADPRPHKQQPAWPEEVEAGIEVLRRLVAQKASESEVERHYRALRKALKNFLVYMP